MQQENIEPSRPPTSAQYLLDLFYEVGPTEASAFGPMPLSFSELEAWARLTHRSLTPSEFITLRRLSMEWLAQAEDAKDMDCQAPYGETTPEQRSAVAKSLREEMREMARGRK